MTLATNRLGRIGELLAVRHLQRAGYTILARGWRAPTELLRGELDVVAVHPGAPHVLVVVEVKARRGARSADDALVAVTPRKLAQVRALAAAFAVGRHADEIRIDVVAVTWPAAGGPAAICHLEGVG